MHYVYQSASGRISIFSIEDPQIFHKKGFDYLQFFDSTTNTYKTPRLDRVLFSSENLETAQAVFDSVYKDPPPRPPRAPSRPKVDAYEICFTGFAKADKERLMALAEEKNMLIRKSVTKELDLLVTGYNAGPKKLESAHKQGVSITYEAGFYHLLETGELLDEV